MLALACLALACTWHAASSVSFARARSPRVRSWPLDWRNGEGRSVLATGSVADEAFSGSRRSNGNRDAHRTGQHDCWLR
jgi:hypothetical protein